jgi:hypothetical protein
MRTCVCILLVLTAACSADQFHDGDKSDSGNPDNNVGGGGDGGTTDSGIDPNTSAVWVSSSQGSATGDGTQAHPLSSLNAAIAKAGKLPVNACAETYAEHVDFGNGVNVFGYYDCNAGWVKSTSHAKIAPTTSPAASASNITSPTRVEAVDIVAPDFTDGSKSSIALFTNNAPALTIAHATIHAGTGGKGLDGVAGIQLTDGASTKNGGDAWADGVCSGAACNLLLGAKTGQAAGGTNACVGETGHDPGPGGAGGAPGEFQSDFFVNSWIWNTVNNANTTAGLPTSPTSQTAQGGSVGIGGSSGAPGANGKDGASGLNFGSMTTTDYVPSSGTTGVAGDPGQGGGGSGGYNALATDYAASTHQGYYAWGEPGAGGGAGGCPGLPGNPGRGGGASFAVVAFGAGFTLDTVTIESSKGGDGGASGVPSAPTAGGFGGHTGGHVNGAGNGGAGGYSGVSGNGGGGPSLGIAYNGTKPTMLACTVKQGAGGAGVAARTVGSQTIPASDNGMSADAYMFGQ